MRDLDSIVLVKAVKLSVNTKSRAPSEVSDGLIPFKAAHAGSNASMPESEN